MNYQQLYKTIDTVLTILPNNIVELIFNYVINIYKYKYSFTLQRDSALFNIIFYNKQLKLIYCSSNNLHKIIDYKTGKHHDSSIIDLNTFESRFDNDIENIICFENNHIISCSDNQITKYKLYNKKYRLVIRITDDNTSFINVYKKYMFVSDRYMYVCENTYFDNYQIVSYDLEKFTRIKQSQLYSCYHRIIQISVYENIIYISELRAEQMFNIYRHDADTLNIIDVREFKEMYNKPIPTMYQDKIYSYVPNIITVYDITTLKELYSINTHPFEKYSQYHISISNGIIMISNETEIMLYEIK